MTEAQRQRRHRRREKARSLIAKAKGTTCVDCGGTFPPHQLHADHRNPGEKEFTIATFVRKPGRSLRRLEAELAKCDPRCSSCHSRRHVRTRRRDERGRFLAEVAGA